MGAKNTGADNVDYARLYEMFGANISKRYDCGRFCAPLNEGQPVCCTSKHAVVVVENTEKKALARRTDLWEAYKPDDAAGRAIVADLKGGSCRAIECKAAGRWCERDNRTLACRSFPFFPYFTKDKEAAGLAYYWTFEDRCWILSNLWVVEATFRREILAAHDYLFKCDSDERESFVDQSATARRVFSRWKRPIPLIGMKGDLLKVMPGSGGRIRPAKAREFGTHGPYTSQRAYEEAIREEGGNPATAPKLPARPAHAS